MKKMDISRFNELKQTERIHLHTGLPELDRSEGFGMDDFCIIAGGSGSGKSTIALFVACTMAKKGKKVAFFNVEMSEKLIQERIEQLGFDFNTDLNTMGLYSGKEISFQALENEIILKEYEVLFLDLFNCLLTKFSDRDKWRMTEEYATRFSFFPEQHKCAVFVTEQLTKDNKRVFRPTLDDVKGGASLIQKATKVIIVYRYVYENLERMQKDVVPNVVHSCTEIVVRKDRMGKINGKMCLLNYWHGEGFKELYEEERRLYVDFVFGGRK